MGHVAAEWAYIMGNWESLLISVAALAGAIIVASLVHCALFWLLQRRASQSGHVLASSLVRHGRSPSKWVLYLIALLLTVPMVPLPETVKNPIEHLIGLGIVATIAWAFILGADLFADVVAARHRIDVRDNLAARRVRTQVQALRRIFAAIVVIITLGIMLLTIPSVRSVGTSLLASAGLAGLVVGMAAKPTLGNLIAGVQLAITQPIRIEDAVIVEGQWGWVEEITSTYVVVRIWNWQRLVLPLTYFLEHPFQNWTRSSAALIGEVHIHADYTLPVDEVRKELDRILQNTDKWAGTVKVLQVTSATENTIELRALADAADAGIAWDLRCLIREGLIKFIQENYPQCLPRRRADLGGSPSPDGLPAPAEHEPATR
ncbi:MAG TPA: mechanosensitive ion channel family protein [Bryobacteraceae bacterium]|nr:mechanosensitive ion channel family protein [Bryobacteraceae bacterium]